MKISLQQQKEIIEAAIAGKEIELRGYYETEWHIKPVFEEARFNFLDFEYRVKRTPRVLYYNEMPDGRLVGRYDTAADADRDNMSRARRVRRIKFVEDLSDEQP